MGRKLGLLIRFIALSLIMAWIVLIIIENGRFKSNKPLIFLLKEEVLEYNDGHVYVYWGLGYKAINYERDSLYGKEFGHIFIGVREELPNGGY